MIQASDVGLPLAIPGSTYIPGYVTGSNELAVLAAIDAEPWLADLKRRVQHHGYRYDYKKVRKTTPSMYLGPLPTWVQSVADSLLAR